VTSTKSQEPIAEADIQDIVDDGCIDELATVGRLPEHADRKRFAEGVRKAAGIYAQAAHVPTDNDLHAEIAALSRTAERKQYEHVAALLEGLSPKARDLLNSRGARPSLGVKLPAAETLRDSARRESARETVRRLCQLGGCYVAGRRRPSGKRSRAWRPLLHAPKRVRNFAKRDAELNFIMWLGIAWLEATGELPSRAANAARPGPFARMVQNCLKLVGAGHANAVGLINELNRRRRIQIRSGRYQN
jgi:hypothetical protein